MTLAFAERLGRAGGVGLRVSVLWLNGKVAGTFRLAALSAAVVLVA